MVKKLIGKLLKKKESSGEQTKDKNVEDVPDELPALVDEVHQEDEKSDEIAKSEEEKKTEAPDEMHDKKEDEKPQPEVEGVVVNDFKDLDKSDDKSEEVAISQSLDSEGLEEEKVSEASHSVSHKEAEEVPEKPREVKPVEIKSKTVPETKPDDGGFFSEVISLTHAKGINDSILKQDLLKRMKNYWYFHPRHKRKFSNKEILQQEIKDELSQLKRLEERWLAQKNFLEEDKRILMEKEREIKLKSDKLQRILSQMKIYKDVAPNKVFLVHNGMKLKNISELMNFLDVIDDKTFNHHVAHDKKHFIDWIRKAVGDKELARKFELAKTREEMIAVLDNVSMGNLYSIEPEEYFKMSNGKIIRDVRELIQELKEIDDHIFKHHVTHAKNDFSFWIRHIYKNDYLADKLLVAHTRRDIIKILENFYHQS